MVVKATSAIPKPWTKKKKPTASVVSVIGEVEFFKDQLVTIQRETIGEPVFGLPTQTSCQ